MNIILVSNSMAKPRHFDLGKKQIVLLSVAAFMLLIITAIVLRYGATYIQGDGINALSPEKRQAYMQSSLDMMAQRVGQMQAQVQRLDALGVKLSEISGVDPKEFDFKQAPPQGGPLLSSQVSPNTEKSLQHELDQLAKLISDRQDKLFALENMLLQSHLDASLLPSEPPVATGWSSSSFGYRSDPFTGAKARHEGIDFVAPSGTSITASAGGVVAFSAYHPQYGNMVEIDHGNETITRYAHASKLLVKVGQVVRSGDKIAEVGSTGRSTGSHLHFEVRYKGVAQNPSRFLKKNTG